MQPLHFVTNRSDLEQVLQVEQAGLLSTPFHLIGLFVDTL